MNRSRIVLRLCLLVMAVTVAPVTPSLPRRIIAGLWRPQPRNQDGSGMIGDYAGVPLSPAGRWRAETWSPDDYDLAEYACRPHAWDYSLEGPLSQMRVWSDVDPGNPEGRRLSRASQSAGAGDHHLDGWSAASARQRAAHVERVHDRCVGRGRARHDDDAPQGNLHPPLWPDAQRSLHRAHRDGAASATTCRSRRFCTTRCSWRSRTFEPR